MKMKKLVFTLFMSIVLISSTATIALADYVIESPNSYSMGYSSRDDERHINGVCLYLGDSYERAENGYDNLSWAAASATIINLTRNDLVEEECGRPYISQQELLVRNGLTNSDGSLIDEAPSLYDIQRAYAEWNIWTGSQSGILSYNAAYNILKDFKPIHAEFYNRETKEARHVVIIGCNKYQNPYNGQIRYEYKIYDPYLGVVTTDTFSQYRVSYEGFDWAATWDLDFR